MSKTAEKNAKRHRELAAAFQMMLLYKSRQDGEQDRVTDDIIASVGKNPLPWGRILDLYCRAKTNDRLDLWQRILDSIDQIADMIEPPGAFREADIDPLQVNMMQFAYEILKYGREERKDLERFVGETHIRLLVRLQKEGKVKPCIDRMNHAEAESEG